MPEYCDRKRCTYPVHTLLGIMAAAHLAAAPRGQQDLEAATAGPAALTRPTRPPSAA